MSWSRLGQAKPVTIAPLVSLILILILLLFLLWEHISTSEILSDLKNQFDITANEVVGTDETYTLLDGYCITGPYEFQSYHIFTGFNASTVPCTVSYFDENDCNGTGTLVTLLSPSQDGGCIDAQGKSVSMSCTF